MSTIRSAFETAGVILILYAGAWATGRPTQAAEDVAQKAGCDAGLRNGNNTPCLNLGRFYLGRKQYQQALFYFDQAQVQRSANPLVLLALTEAYFGAGKVQQAREVAARLSRLTKVGARIHFSLGLLLAEHGEYRMAAEQFAAIPFSERDAATDLDLGMTYSKLKRFHQARTAYDEAIQLDPANPNPYFHIGLDESSMGHHQAAVDWLTQAHDKAPERPEIAYALAEELIRVGNFERAQGLLAAAEVGHGADPALLEALGDLYLSQDQPEKAVSAYEKCLRIDHENVRARLSLARSYEDMRQTAKAKAALQNILRIDPANGEAKAQLGHLALEAGNDNDALVLIDDALARDPRNPMANEDYVRLQIRRGNLPQAEQTLRRLVWLYPKNPRFHYLLGRVLVRLHQTTEAEREFDISRELETKLAHPEE